MLTTIVVLLCSVTVCGYDFKVDGICYNIIDKKKQTVSVDRDISYGGFYGETHVTKYSGCVEIPESVTYNSKTYTVTAISRSAFYECYGLTSVTIPNSITSIGEKAFYDCDGISSITIPNSVTSIGYEAFYDCDGISSITIPNSVTSIGEETFYDCDGLTSVTIGDSVKTIGERAFQYCI